MTIATLGLAVRSDGIDEGVIKLKTIAAEAGRAEGAVTKVGAASSQASGGVRQLAGAAEAEARSLSIATTAANLNSRALQLNGAASRMAANNQRMLGFQINDVVVSLASGMNPAMVALQQGSQIAQMGLRDVASAAAGMASKLSLAGVAAAGVAVTVAALTTEINRGHKTQVSFFEVMQAGWELASERIVNAFGPVVDWLGGLWDWLSPRLAGGLLNIVRNFDLAFRDIKTIWSMLPAAIGDAVFRTAESVTKWVAKMVNDNLHTINTMVQGLRALAPFLPAYIDEVRPPEMGRNPYTGSEAAFQKQMTRNRLDVLTTDYGGLIGNKAREIHNRPSEDELKKMQKEAERMAEAYADITRAAEQRIAQSQLEASTLGMTAEAIAKARYEQELFNKAANDNIKLTPDQVTELRGLADAMAAAEERTRQLTELYDVSKSIFSGFFSDLRSNLMDGEDLWGSFADAASSALDKIASKVLDMAVSGIFDMLFSAIMGGIGGPAASVATSFIPGIGGILKRADGGVVTGPGSGTSDSIPMLLSNGEYVVNAAATAAFRPLLDAINSGAIGHMASGGAVHPGVPTDEGDGGEYVGNFRLIAA